MQPKILTKMIDLARRGYTFTAADGQAFLRFNTFDGCHTIPVRSAGFREWFTYACYCELDSPPTSRQFHTILDLLEGEANSDESRRGWPVYRRVGLVGPRRLPDQIILDLANSRYQFVEIAPTGWKLAGGPTALFQTSRSTLSLPAPVSTPAGGPSPLDTLRSCLNLPSRAAWLRCLAWLLSAFHPYGPFPFLIIQGPPSSGKSLAARVLRYMVDPSSAPLTPIPSSVRDLLTLARHNWILAFDHISTLSPPLTDALCRLSSGLGAAVRETFGPLPDPLHQYIRRPILLTVTERWTCPADIAKRALVVTLPPLTAGARPEDSILSALDGVWPAIVGALCTAVSTALRRMPQMTTPTGRCASALAWAMAAAPALGCTEEEIERAFDPPPPPDPMVEAVRNLLHQSKEWKGSATELRELMEPFITCTTPKGVSQQLRNSTLTLADYGIELKFKRLHEGARIIELREDPGDASCKNDPPDASPDSEPSPQPEETEEVTPS